MKSAIETPISVAPRWQCVLICWGDKYPVALINNLIAAIARHAAHPPRFVLLSDAPRPGLNPAVEVRMMPAFFLQAPLRRSGCQAKLAMFEKGVLEEDLPAIYVDLDTVVTGDLSAGIALMKTPRTMLILQSALLPLGRIGRFVWRLSGKKRYARGNSSIVIFHPAHCHHIAATFRELFRDHPNFEFRPMVADERFMSWAMQETIERIPADFAVKFPTEFMSRLNLLNYIWAALPWVRARRDRLVAVTFPGEAVKHEALLALEDGGMMTDRKGRKLIWSDRILGKVRRDIIAFYAPLG